MDVKALERDLAKFIERHRVEFQAIYTRQSQLLELGAFMVAIEHYRRYGYGVTPRSPVEGTLRVKLGSRGHPWNYSWFEVESPVSRFEIHSNLAVRSAYGKDRGVYVVDVAIVRPDRVPRRKSKNRWVALENRDLITFIEAKRLVIYPMLLAQFIGIVHEIKPSFIVSGRRPPRFKREGHFYPALLSIGYLHGTAASIERAYKLRRFLLTVVPAFDTEISRLARDEATFSPLISE